MTLNYLKLVLFFLLLFFITFPLKGVYFKIEEMLENENIIISNEKFTSNLFSLNTSQAEVFYKDLNIASVERMKITSFLFYSKVDAQLVQLKGSLKSLFPLNIDTLDIKHSLFTPYLLNFEAIGVFGVIKGTYNISRKNLTLRLEASQVMKKEAKMILGMMKVVEGGYIYEYKF